MNETAEIPLSNIKTGQKVKLIRVDAGEGLKSRLAASGWYLMYRLRSSIKVAPGRSLLVSKVPGSLWAGG